MEIGCGLSLAEYSSLVILATAGVGFYVLIPKHLNGNKIEIEIIKEIAFVLNSRIRTERQSGHK